MIEHDNNYWDRKIQFFLHDPPDKAISIPGHENRAKNIAQALGTTTPDKNEVVRPDVTAAGIDRARLPGYSPDKSKSGAVDFNQHPVLTHALAGHRIEFSSLKKSAEETTEQIIFTIEQDTRETNWDRKDYFFYLYFLLQKSLAASNAAGLGFLWEHLPADTRMPDHSVWSHCSMVSALRSCFDQSDTQKASLVVFSITPVQPFIEKARKLKDHWAGSVILSWLAFEGIKTIMDLLGPDHIMYPAIDNQPFVKWMLREESGLNAGDILDRYEALFPIKQNQSVASLPNKFVFLAPAGKEKEICQAVQEKILGQWKNLSSMVESFIVKHTGIDPDKGLHSRFDRQVNGYWQLNFACAALTGLSDRELVGTLFEKEKFNAVFNTMADFSKGYTMDPAVYPVSHALAQAALAASKMNFTSRRKAEPGKKCPICGEFEILHNQDPAAPGSPSQDRASREAFWRGFSMDSATLKPEEQFCALCAIKRFLPRVIKQYGKNHVLHSVFKDHEKFPSTTEMAAGEFLDALEAAGLLNGGRDKLIDELHEKESPDFSPEIRELLKQAGEKGITLQESDKYYAILVMDGDKMGDLVNGETIGATWKDVLHPDLAVKFDQKRFPGGFLAPYLDTPRMTSPSVHSTLSKSLENFSLFAVPGIIEAQKGKLIYAGGDDVAAALPLSRAIEAARNIRRVYGQGFSVPSEAFFDPASEILNTDAPFFSFLGTADKISISGAILICHHKQPLRGAIQDAHQLLNLTAKKELGRNGLAVKLQKRSGHSRIFTAKWEESVPCRFVPNSVSKFNSFSAVLQASREGLLSARLAYRLKDLEISIKSFIGKSENISLDSVEKIKKIIAYEIGHSGRFNEKFPGRENLKKRTDMALTLASHIAELTLYWNNEDKEWEFRPDVPEMAVFLAKGGME